MTLSKQSIIIPREDDTKGGYKTRYFVMPEGIFFDIYTRQFLNVKEENNYVIRR